MTRIAFFGKDTTDHLCHRICPDRLCFPAKFAKEHPDPGVTCPSALITSYRPRTGAPAGQQRRLKGRMVLEPEIDLGRYRARAVIDHLSVVMTCQGHPNRAAISKHLSRATGCPVSVKAYGNALTARVQDVTPDRLRRLVGAIQRAETLHTDGRLAEIEVSVDFYARDHRDETRWELTDILWRHLRPEGSVWRQEEGEARCCYGDGWHTYKIFKVRQSEGQRTMHAALTMLNRGRGLPDRVQGEALKEANIFNYGQHAVDGTFYLGPMDGDVLFRCMHKVMDRQDRGAGEWQMLDPRARRVRVEVRLRGAALEEAELASIETLGQGLAGLRRRHFRFWLPTVARDEGRSQGYLPNWVEPWREAEVFCRAGVYGLARQRLAQRARLDALRGARGVSGKPKLLHVGTEHAVDQLAWSELNDRIGKALARLAKGWGRETR